MNNFVPRGIRNNNPGNIRLSMSTTWLGQVQGDDPSFCTFDTDAHGIRAIAKIIVNYERKDNETTVREMINRWAPPAENDTSAYVDAVASGVGVGADDTIDVTNPTTLASIVTAIIQHENGQQPYEEDLILTSVQEAL